MRLTWTESFAAFALVAAVLLAVGAMLLSSLLGKPQTDIETIGWQVTKKFDGHVRFDCGAVQTAETYCFAVPMSPLQAAAVLEGIGWRWRFGAVPLSDTWEETFDGGYLPFKIDGRNFAVIVTGGVHDVSAGVLLALSRE